MRIAVVWCWRPSQVNHRPESDTVLPYAHLAECHLMVVNYQSEWGTCQGPRA